jgi:hypothetical protein
VDTNNVGNHPNAWFAASVAYLNKNSSSSGADPANNKEEEADRDTMVETAEGQSQSPEKMEE